MIKAPEIVRRRICWPTPDATCLHGGCGYCNMSRFRSIKTIEKYARAAGDLYHRGGQTEDGYTAFMVGFRNHFYNAEVEYKYPDGKVVRSYG